MNDESNTAKAFARIGGKARLKLPINSAVITVDSLLIVERDGRGLVSALTCDGKCIVRALIAVDAPKRR